MGRAVSGIAYSEVIDMVVLTTPEGWTFNSQAFVNIKGTYYDMDELTPEQKRWVSTMLNVQGLNAAYAGKRVYRPAEPLPPLEEVFPEFAGSAEHPGAGG